MSPVLDSAAMIGYLDPGAGSMILQIVLGGAAAVAVGARFYWRRLLRFLRIRRPEEEAPG